MIKMKKIMAGILFVLGLMIPLTAYAINIGDEEVTTCPGDYYNFIFNVGIEQSRLHYFKDFVTLGYCQLYDIIELYDELDNLRDNFRSAAFACEDTSDYKEEYYEIKMEVYFVRNIQKTSSEILNSSEIEKREDPVLKEKSLEKLFKEMKTLYVDEEDWVTENELENYFEIWGSKYEDKIGQYARCEEGVWAELSETWTSFIEDIKDLSIEVEKGERQSFKDQIAENVELDDEFVETGELGQSVLNSWKYFLKDKEERILEDVDPPKTAGDLAGEGLIFSIGSALSALEESEIANEAALAFAERQAMYERLYGEGGAVAATNMQGILSRMSSVIEEANNKHLPNILLMTSQVYDKQCN